MPQAELVEDVEVSVSTEDQEVPEQGPRKRYPVQTIDRARYGRAEKILGSKRLEYWHARRSIGGEEVSWLDKVQCNWIL